MTDTPTKEPTELKLTILLRASGSAWFAQCLEYDVAAQGPTAEDCKVRFMRTLSSRILRDLSAGRVPLVDLQPAPRRYFEQSILFRDESPELPVYVPVKTNTRTTARFLETKERSPGVFA
jgi:hypothetical protein